MVNSKTLSKVLTDFHLGRAKLIPVSQLLPSWWRAGGLENMGASDRTMTARTVYLQRQEQLDQGRLEPGVQEGPRSDRKPSVWLLMRGQGTRNPKGGLTPENNLVMGKGRSY